MADLDDILGGLLADDPAKKTAPPRRGMPTGRTPPSKMSDDAFYSNLAAQVDDEADISDADPKEIAKSLGDMDDMDAALFGSKKPASSPQKAAAVPPAKASPTPASRSKKIDFGDFDEDDPLAGLLSDEDDSPRQQNKLAGMPSTAPSTKPRTAPRQADSSNTAVSQRPAVERPPTRSGKNAPDEKAGPHRRTDDDVTFGDDDDLLGGLGLGSPRRKVQSAGEVTHTPGGAKSVLGDLLGSDHIKEQLQPPGSGQKKEFVLDRRYVKSAGEARSGSTQPKAEFTEEDMTFGAYMPSAASSRPSSQRSVRFEDEPLAAPQPKSRASTAPGQSGRRHAPSTGSFLEEMIDKDSRDWLDMASGAKERPKSAGAEQSKPVRPSTSQSAASEPVDWLGLSTLGSPRSPDEAEVATARERKPTDPPAKKATTEGHSSSISKPDDWLGASKESNQSKAGAITSDDSDWLGLRPASKGRSQSQPASSSNAGDDWLGLKDETDTAADAAAPLDLHSEPTGPESNSPTKRADQIFTQPASAEVSSPFPWDSQASASASASPQRGRRARPQPHRTQSQTPGGGDASEGLDATLDALLQAERRPPASPSPQPQTSQAPVMMQQQQQPSSALVVPSGQQPQSQPQLLQQQSQQHTLQQQLQQQQELLRQQQAHAEQKLRQFQEQQQQLLQEQQMRQLQEQQLRQQELMQRQLAEQQTYTLQSQPLSIGITLSDNLESQVKRLELERLHLLSILDTVKQQHQEEIKVIEESHRKKMQLFEETFEKREQRLQRENQFLSEQCMAKLQQAERDKQELMTAQSNREKLWQAQKDEDMQRLRESQKHSMQDLRQEHEDALERLKKMQSC